MPSFVVIAVAEIPAPGASTSGHVHRVDAVDENDALTQVAALEAVPPGRTRVLGVCTPANITRRTVTGGPPNFTLG